MNRFALLAVVAFVSACASKPPVPDWELDAKSSLDRSTAAWLAGNTRVADAELARARAAVGSTGRVDALARVELNRCAAQVASLDLQPCARFEVLRADAPAAESAYADYLAGRASGEQAALLPPWHREALAQPQALASIADPLARLVAAGALMAAGRATPQTAQLAVDTASAQGWRRPLLAWLGVQVRLAEQAGRTDEVARLRRRIEIASAP